MAPPTNACRRIKAGNILRCWQRAARPRVWLRILDRRTSLLSGNSGRMCFARLPHGWHATTLKNKRSQLIAKGAEDYPRVPTMIGCVVGADDPCSGSTVIAKVLASTPGGRGGRTTAALPFESGRNNPAGMGAPLVGINHNS